MKKTKLILFGAEEEIVGITKKAIKSDRCEIVAICDSSYKQGIVWDKVPVVSVERIKLMEYDFVVVGDWHNYHTVEQNLINAGIPTEKILPVLSLRTIKKLSTPINTYPESILAQLFVDNPKQINAKILELNEVSKRYHSIKPISYDIDFNEYPLIAHGGGGYIPNRKLTYTNSIEALKLSIEAGFKMFELDFYTCLEDDILIGHDDEMVTWLKLRGCNSLKFSDIISILNNNADFRIISDIKWRSFKEYVTFLNLMDKMLLQNERVKQQIFIQVYNQETAEYTVNNGWKCLLTNYRNVDGDWIQKSALLCCELGLYGMVLSVNGLFGRFNKYLHFIKDKNIPIIAYTVNSLDEYIRLKAIGISSVMTDFLKPYN